MSIINIAIEAAKYGLKLYKNSLKTEAYKEAKSQLYREIYKEIDRGQRKQQIINEYFDSLDYKKNGKTFINLWINIKSHYSRTFPYLDDDFKNGKLFRAFRRELKNYYTQRYYSAILRFTWDDCSYYPAIYRPRYGNEEPLTLDDLPF